jgi:hypothetical protein
MPPSPAIGDVVAAGRARDPFDGRAAVAGGSARLGREHPPVLLQSFEDVDGDVVSDGVRRPELVEDAAGGGGDAVDECGELGDRFDVGDASEGKLPAAEATVVGRAST